ncbi:MAG: NAD(P) transhydrogenase subunit alpha [Candidatus Marinamargulisbacteria bacterium]|jgi:NAD(P) transhydrogenase subunit alpha
MHILFPKESKQDETRLALDLSSAEKLLKRGVRISVEAGAGKRLFSDDSFRQTGVSIVEDVSSVGADMVVRINPPTDEEIGTLSANTIHISLMDPFLNDTIVGKLQKANVTALSLEMIPRSTRAQKMDVLSSQASLAGYQAVISAAEQLDRVLPMMMTPAGTLAPSRVFVIGAGVAGLQAIATAKRLGARVEAFDTRPVVEEQVQSLGAKFVKVDLGDAGETTQGYAKALTQEQIEKQREVMAKHCGLSDIVITTAQLFGRKAPIIVTRDMLKRMRPGSIIVDLAVETGGNVEKPEAGQADGLGVQILNGSNLSRRVAYHATQMFASNVFSLIDEFWDSETKRFDLNLEDEILKGAVVTHQGNVVNQQLLSAVGAK